MLCWCICKMRSPLSDRKFERFACRLRRKQDLQFGLLVE